MIRFVDIRGQGLLERFAFWDTFRDEWVYIQGTCAWSSRKNLVSDLLYGSNYGNDRLLNMLPAWADDNNEDFETISVRVDGEIEYDSWKFA